MAEPGKHILTTFDIALNNLRNELLMMGSLVERNLRNAIKGLVDRDDELCTAAIADDEELDILEKEVDRDGIELLRRFQPVAKDLRDVISAMKISGSLERIGDQAASISKKARALNRKPILEDVHLIEPMFNEAISMFEETMKAFGDRNIDLALGIRARDKKLDRLYRGTSQRFAELMASNPDRIADYLNLILIARHVERVGDHAKGVADEIVFAISSADVRHPGISPLED